MENTLFIRGFPMNTSIHRGFSIAMFAYQRLSETEIKFGWVFRYFPLVTWSRCSPHKTSHESSIPKKEIRQAVDSVGTYQSRQQIQGVGIGFQLGLCERQLLSKDSNQIPGIMVPVGLGDWNDIAVRKTLWHLV